MARSESRSRERRGVRRYRFQVDGPVEDAWIYDLGSRSSQVEVGRDGGVRTTVTGDVRDQTHLRSTLGTLIDFGCVIVSVERLEDTFGGSR